MASAEIYFIKIWKNYISYGIIPLKTTERKTYYEKPFNYYVCFGWQAN